MAHGFQVIVKKRDWNLLGVETNYASKVKELKGAI